MTERGFVSEERTGERNPAAVNWIARRNEPKIAGGLLSLLDGYCIILKAATSPPDNRETTSPKQMPLSPPLI